MANRFVTGIVFLFAAVCVPAAQQSAQQTINPAATPVANAAESRQVAAESQQPAAPVTESTAVHQRTAAPVQASGQSSLADFARQQRGGRNAVGTVPASGSGRQKSLGEIAAERRVTRPVRPSFNEDGSPRKTKARATHRKKKDPFRPVSTAK